MFWYMHDTGFDRIQMNVTAHFQHSFIIVNEFADMAFFEHMFCQAVACIIVTGISLINERQ